VRVSQTPKLTEIPLYGKEIEHAPKQRDAIVSQVDRQ